MNRHFYNFVAIFNSKSKTSKEYFTLPLRSCKRLSRIFHLLYRLGFIRDYVMPTKWVYNKNGDVCLGKRQSKYYHPVKITFKTGFFPRIKSVSTPGKQHSYSYRKLLRLHNSLGDMATIIVSSSVTGSICTSSELLARGNYGGLVLFVIYHYHRSARKKSKKTFA